MSADVARRAVRPDWSLRQATFYTRAGMEACQGRVRGPALRLLFGRAPDTARPPIEPILLSTLVADAAPVPPPDHGA